MENVDQVLEKFDSINRDELKREGKELNFDDVHPFILDIFGAIDFLKNNKDFLNRLPQSKKDQIIRVLNDFESQAVRIQSFNIEAGNPGGERNDIASRIKSNYDELFDCLLMPMKMYLLEEKLSEAKIKEFSEKIVSESEDISKKHKEIERILEAAQKASGSIGVSKFSGVFQEQARNNFWWAMIFGIASSAVMVVGIVFLVNIFNDFLAALRDKTAGGIDLQFSVQVLIAKFLILSFFSVVFYQVVKSFNANMHLYNVNKHRENCLKTFETFVNATKDSAVKDTVLIEATKAIFKSGDTGYISTRGKDVTDVENIRVVKESLKGK